MSVYALQAGLLPWLDAQHRRYFLARDEHKKIVAICVLAAIAHDSYQIKHAVTFVRPFPIPAVGKEAVSPGKARAFGS